MSDRIDYYEVSPRGVKALAGVSAYVSQSGLPADLLELVHLRISLINGCAYCVDMHTQDLHRRDVPAAKIALVPVWREAGAWFDDRERAALAWAESLTLIADTHAPDDVYDAAARVFDEKELADLTIAIGLMNAYNRLAIGLRKPPASTP